ncbi:hypothetical protein [Kordia sp.]|uniref:hypothetical protein n=1 Tax=Kordia sp. TaxID=1965332 RepID=UPI003D6C16C5
MSSSKKTKTKKSKKVKKSKKIKNKKTTSKVSTSNTITKPSYIIQDSEGTVLKRSFVGNFKFTDLFKNIKSPAIDAYVFKNVLVALNLEDNTITFTGDLRMSGALTKFKSYFDTNATMPMKAIFKTSATNLKSKISVEEMDFTATATFFKRVFTGVTMTAATMQLNLTQEEGSWNITPSFTGKFDVNNVTDAKNANLTFSLTLQKNTLIINASGANLQGAFGIKNLPLENISITGKIGRKKLLTFSAELNAAAVVFNFAGIIKPSAVGISAQASSFTMNQLNSVFQSAFPDSLEVPSFDVTFENTLIALASDEVTIDGTDFEKGFTLQSTITAHSHTIDTEAQISTSGVTFDGSITDLVVDEITISKASLDFAIHTASSNKPTFFEFSGKSTIKGIGVDCGVYFEKATNWITVLFATFDLENFKFSDVNTFKPAKGTIIDDLVFTEANFIYASADCSIKIENESVHVQEGLQLKGVIEKVPHLFDLTHKSGGKTNQPKTDPSQEGLVLTAHFGETDDITIAIPDTSIKLTSSVKTEPFKIRIVIEPDPQLELIFGIQVTVHGQKQPLIFDMILDIDAAEVSGSVSMLNPWRNAMGIHSVNIGTKKVPLALGLTINPEEFFTTGIPEAFSMSGGLKIADTTVAMAVKIAEDPLEEIVMGKLENLNPSQLINFAAKIMPVKIPTVPTFFTINTLKLYCAPAGGFIGTKYYNPGFSFDANLVFFKKTVAMYFDISEDGVAAKGEMEGFTFGALTVTGAKGKDAQFDFSLTTTDQKLKVNAAFMFLDIEELIYINITDDSLAFNFKQEFGPIAKYSIQGQSAGDLNTPSTLSFGMSGTMQNDVLNYLSSTLKTRLNSTVKKADTTFTDAQNTLAKAKKKFDKVLNAAQSALKKAQIKYKQLVAERKAALQKAKDQQPIIAKKAQKAVANAEEKYTKTITELKTALKKANKAFNSVRGPLVDAENRAYTIYSTALQKAQNTANQAYHTYQLALTEDKQEVVRWQKKLNYLKKDYYHFGTTLAAYGIAEGYLEAVKLELEATSKSSQWVANNIAQKALKEAETGTNYQNWQAAMRSVNALANSAEKEAVYAASQALAAAKSGPVYEAWKDAQKAAGVLATKSLAAINNAKASLNDVENTSEHKALVAAKAALKAIQNGVDHEAYVDAQTALTAAKMDTQLIRNLGDYLAKQMGTIINVTSFTFKGELAVVQKNSYFNATVVVTLIHTNHTWEINFNPKKVEDFISIVFNKVISGLEALDS